MSRLRPIALSLIGLSTGFAQNEAPQPPGGVLIPPSPPATPGATPAVPPVPGAPPVISPAPPVPGGIPGAPGVPQGQVPLSERKLVDAINEPKLTGNDLADLYRKYTGRRVIVSSGAALAEFSFVQDATPENPLTYAQAAELLKKAAVIENFVFVPDATDPNLDILTVSTGGLNPKGRGISVYTENDPLPPGDEVISYVMNLQYLKPDAVVSVFQQIIGQFGAYGSIAPVANASAVVITENTSLIRKLIDLKKEIDKPSSQVATRFIKVEYADVTELATTLNELLTAQQSAQQQTAGVQRAAAPGAPPVPGVEVAGGGGGSGGEQTPVQIVPDPRTNRIFAMGRPVDLLFIEGLVREFDTQSDQRNFLRRKLRFLKVSEFLPIARNALTRAFSGSGDAAGGGAAGAAGGAAGGATGAAATRGTTANRSRTSTAGRSTSSTSATNFGGGGGMGSSGSGSSLGGSSLGDPNVSTAPESDLVGRTLLVADNITNSIVVQGPPSGVEIIEKLLDEIDVKADQVMLSCIIGQLSLSDGHSFGVDYVRTLNGRFAGRGGAGQGGVIDLLPGTTYDPGTLGAASGLSLYGKIGNSMNIYLDAMQTDSNFKVLSRPTIFTANNQKGSIISGRQIAVPTNSYSSGVSTTSSTNYEYKDVAIQLEVIPLVNSRDEVTLQVFLTSDDVGADRDVGTGENQYAIPDILKRELITTVTVPNNQTIVLGGLIDEQITDSRSGIPVLNRLPWVGPLFGSKTKGITRSELLVFIQPTVVHDDRSLTDSQMDMDMRYKTSGTTRKFADGPGVLPPPDAVPVSDKAGRQVELVDPKPKPAPVHTHGTRFRSTPR